MYARDACRFLRKLTLDIGESKAETTAAASAAARQEQEQTRGWLQKQVLLSSLLGPAAPSALFAVHRLLARAEVRAERDLLSLEGGLDSPSHGRNTEFTS